jgi:hypothetical protein
VRLSLSNIEHKKTAICNSSRQVNIGQQLIVWQTILAFSTRHGIEAAGISGVRTLVKPTT